MGAAQAHQGQHQEFNANANILGRMYYGQGAGMQRGAHPFGTNVPGMYGNYAPYLWLMMGRDSFQNLQ